MANRRQKDVNWLVGDERGNVVSWDQAHAALLMDIRDELKAIRIAVEGTHSTLRCPNFLEIPRILRTIRANTRKPKRRKKLALVKSA